jgi:hypothetical protein
METFPASTSSPSPPPAYDDRSATPGYLWRIRNTKIRSTLLARTPVHTPTLREHIERIKDPAVYRRWQTEDSGSEAHRSRPVEVDHNEALADIGRLVCEYRDKLSEVEPLQEEDVLFLLLSQYAQASGSGVYVEIRQLGEVQVYDSSSSETMVRDNSQVQRCVNHANDDARQHQLWRTYRHGHLIQLTSTSHA